MRTLKGLGFRVLVIWECKIRDEKSLIAKLNKFLG
jgi:G:T-mismatch repair DNA endonuclease (very short patch repair protein)